MGRNENDGKRAQSLGILGLVDLEVTKRRAISALFFLLPFFLQAQASDYKVVFDLTSKDTMDHKAVIRWINEISKSTPGANLEVVLYGQSLDMVVKNKSIVANEVAKLTANKNISFKVCEIAMKNHNINMNELDI